MPRRRKWHPIPCLVCGAVFKPRTRDHKMCSLACKGKDQTAKRRMTCVRGHSLADNRRSNGTCRACRTEDGRARRMAKGKRQYKVGTHCIRGHPLTTDNLKGGTRKGGCLTCHRDWMRAKNRAAGAKHRVPRSERTTCSQGHPRTPETIRRGRHAGECAICHRLRARGMTAPDVRAYVSVLAFDPCSYCGGPGGEFDHITPRAMGGLDTADNLTSACHSCNSSKRTKTLLRFLCEAG